MHAGWEYSRETARAGIDYSVDPYPRRADTVAGVPRTTVSADGHGEAKPVASNSTAEGRAQNRRIEVTLVGPGN